MLASLPHHWWSENGPLNLRYHSSPNYLYTRRCHYVHKGMGMSIYCLVIHFPVCKCLFWNHFCRPKFLVKRYCLEIFFFHVRGFWRSGAGTSWGVHTVIVERQMASHWSGRWVCGITGYWSAWSAVYGVERSMFQTGHVVYVWHFM